MHIPTNYETFILEKSLDYLKKSGEIPLWLRHEKEVYDWVFRIARKMGFIAHNNGMVPGSFLNRLWNIESIRFLKYENISRSCKLLLKNVIWELTSLYKDLKEDRMWVSSWYDAPFILSEEGLNRWRVTVSNIIFIMGHIQPDTKWEQELRKFKKMQEIRKEAV